MSDLPSSLLVPQAPQVNLIPPEVASRKAAGRARGLILIALLLFVGLLLAIFYWTSAQERTAAAELADAERIGAELNAEIAKYAEVPQVQTQLANGVSARLYAGATEIRWDSLLKRMRVVMPVDVDISTASFAASSAIAPVGPIPGPYVEPGVGLVSFSARASTLPDVAALERAINSVPGFTDARIPAVNRVVEDGVAHYEFSGTATLTVEALDLRFTDEWFVLRSREIAGEYLDELIAASDAEVAAARASVSAGESGAATILEDALARQVIVTDALEAFTSLGEALTAAEASLDEATAAQEAGEEGADALVASAQQAVDLLTPALGDLTSAVLATREASRALDTTSTRVDAAEALVAAMSAQRVAAEAALAAATADREALEDDVEYYQVLESEAEDVLETEEATVGPAEEALSASFDALASATAAGVTAVVTADVEVTLLAPGGASTEPDSTSSPSPTASPSPSTTQGGDV